MALGFLLDTSIVSELINRPDDPSNRAAIMIARRGVDRVAISVIVEGEVRAGVEKNGGVRLRQQANAVLTSLVVLGVDPPVASTYAQIRTNLERRGCVIGANDLWIAAHALALDMTVVTANTDEFSRVEGLRVENWLEA